MNGMMVMSLGAFATLFGPSTETVPPTETTAIVAAHESPREARCAVYPPRRPQCPTCAVVYVALEELQRLIACRMQGESASEELGGDRPDFVAGDPVGTEESSSVVADFIGDDSADIVTDLTGGTDIPVQTPDPQTGLPPIAVVANGKKVADSAVGIVAEQCFDNITEATLDTYEIAYDFEITKMARNPDGSIDMELTISSPNGDATFISGTTLTAYKISEDGSREALTSAIIQTEATNRFTLSNIPTHDASTMLIVVEATPPESGSIIEEVKAVIADESSDSSSEASGDATTILVEAAPTDGGNDASLAR